MVFVLLNSIFILLKYKDFSANIVKNNLLKKIPLKLLLLQRNEVKMISNSILIVKVLIISKVLLKILGSFILFNLDDILSDKPMAIFRRLL